MIPFKRNGEAIDPFLDVDTNALLSDFKGEPPKSTKNYLICFTGRCGSTMLCSLLEKTGLFGAPAEFINPRGPLQKVLQECPSKDIKEYFEIIRRRKATPNGVFGMKATFQHLSPFLEKELVGELMAPLNFIYMERKDLVLQAISSFKAQRSGRWHSHLRTTVLKEVEYDEKCILQIVNKILTQKKEWEKFFCLYGLTPLRISYEELLLDSKGILKKISSFLDVDGSFDVDLSDSVTHKIGSSENEEWASRIRQSYTL